jgi:hypothetical protein
MTIQQFADQLKHEEGVAPIVQISQALRKCTLDQIWAAVVEEDSGWIPWGVASTPGTLSNGLAR